MYRLNCNRLYCFTIRAIGFMFKVKNQLHWIILLIYFLCDSKWTRFIMPRPPHHIYFIAFHTDYFLSASGESFRGYHYFCLLLLDITHQFATPLVWRLSVCGAQTLVNAPRRQCTTRKWPESVWSLSETDKNGDGVFQESRSYLLAKQRNHWTLVAPWELDYTVAHFKVYSPVHLFTGKTITARKSCCLM